MKKISAWNKGLTKETDLRVKKTGETIKRTKYIYNKVLDKEKRVKKEELLEYFEMGYKLGRRPFSEEHKQKIGKAQIGEKQINKNGQNKKVKEKDIQKYLNDGWKMGRSEKIGKNISKAQIGQKRIYNEELDDERAVKKEELPKYFKIGYVLGKRPFSNKVKQNIRLASIKKVERNIKNGGQLTPFYNRNGCKYFNNLMKETNTFIQHAENGGEYNIKELGYWVDGYDKINNIVYEYDENGHYNLDGTLKEKDIQRQNEIIEHLNCKFIRIKENIN